MSRRRGSSRDERAHHPTLPIHEHSGAETASSVTGGGSDTTPVRTRLDGAELEEAARLFQQQIQFQATREVSLASAAAEEAKREAADLVARIGSLASQHSDAATERLAQEALRCQREVDAANARAERRVAEARDKEKASLESLEAQATAYKAKLDEARQATDAEAAERVKAAERQHAEARQEISNVTAAANQAVTRVQDEARRVAAEQAAHFEKCIAANKARAYDDAQSQIANLQLQFHQALRDERARSERHTADVVAQLSKSAHDQQQAMVAVLNQQQTNFQQALLELRSQRDDLSGQLRVARARSQRAQSHGRTANRAKSKTRALSRPAPARAEVPSRPPASGGGDPPRKGGAGKTTDGAVASSPRASVPKAKAKAKVKAAGEKSSDPSAGGAGNGTPAPTAGSTVVSFLSDTQEDAGADGAGFGAWDERGRPSSERHEWPPDWPDDEGDGDEGDDDDYWEGEGEEEEEEEEAVARSEVSSISPADARHNSTHQSEVDSLRNDVARLEGMVSSLTRPRKKKEDSEGRESKKEAESMKLPDLFSKDKFPEWWTCARQATVGCAFGDADGAFIWFLEIEDKGLEELKDPGTKKKLDAKLGTAATNAVRNRPQLASIISQDEENRKNRSPPELQRGRQVCWLILDHHRTREGVGKLYDIKDLLSVKLKGHTNGHLRAFRQLWQKIDSRCRSAVDDATKLAHYFEQVEKHPGLKDDIRDFKKATNSKDPERVKTANLQMLYDAVDELLLAEDHEQARHAQTKAIEQAGQSIGAPAPKGKGKGTKKKKRKKGKGKGADAGKGSPKGKGKGGQGGNAQPQQPAQPQGRGRGRGRGKGKSRGNSMPRPAAPATMPPNCCVFYYVHGSCKKGANCPDGQHIRPNGVAKAQAAAPAPARAWKTGPLPAGSIKKPCAAETAKPGSCEYGPNCAYAHAQAAAPAPKRKQRKAKA